MRKESFRLIAMIASAFQRGREGQNSAGIATRKIVRDDFSKRVSTETLKIEGRKQGIKRGERDKDVRVGIRWADQTVVLQTDHQ